MLSHAQPQMDSSCPSYGSCRYYENCEPNEQIPMNIQQKAEMITAMIFPDLYDDSEDVEIEAIPEEWEEQLAEHPEWMTEFLQACAAETDRMAVVSHLWTEPPEQQLQQTPCSAVVRP